MALPAGFYDFIELSLFGWLSQIARHCDGDMVLDTDWGDEFPRIENIFYAGGVCSSTGIQAAKDAASASAVATYSLIPARRCLARERELLEEV